MLRVDLVKKHLKYVFTSLRTRITVNYLFLGRIFCSFMVLCSCLSEPGSQRAVLVHGSHHGCAGTGKWFYWCLFKSSCALKNMRSVILPWAAV